MTRFIQLFASDSQNFRKQLHDTVICQFNVAQNVADLYRSVFFRTRFYILMFNRNYLKYVYLYKKIFELYRERVHTREVERFRAAHQNILAKHWNEFVSYLLEPVCCKKQQKKVPDQLLVCRIGDL